MAAASEEVYTFSRDWEKEPDFAYLERCVDGRWYRLNYSQDEFSHNRMDFPVGGDEAVGFQGSLVPPREETFSYTARRGDTLWGLSRRFGTTVEAPVRLHRIANPDLIYPGQVLQLPA